MNILMNIRMTLAVALLGAAISAVLASFSSHLASIPYHDYAGAILGAAAFIMAKLKDAL